MTNLRLRLLSYVVIAYMLLAFGWWSILLFTKNQDAFRAKTELLKIGLAAEGIVQSPNEFQNNPAFQNLYNEYKRQEWMILGEAFVFVISLVIGVWLINRSYNKEINAATQRRNFLLSITHELKSPIASIRLVLETFLKRELKKEQGEKLTQNALKETDRLNELVDNLLLAAKVETAYQPVKEKIDLAQLFADIISKLRTKYPKVKFSLIQPSPLDPIKADKLGLSSIAFNLLENAIKYSNKESQVQVQLLQDNGTVQLKVADNGIGIPDTEKKHIFKRFYRVGNEDTRQTKGTGLGLYIVSEIVKAHNGKISVEDNKPSGTVFKIKLPVNS